MSILTIEQHNAQAYSALRYEMFRLRARVFHDRLGWDVVVVDDMEFDRFDIHFSPVYLIYTDDMRTVKGSLRLLPTTGPTLLAEAFPDTLGDAVNLVAPSIWECTRFCVDPEADAVAVSGALIAGLGDVAIKAGITTILGNFDTPMLRIYRRIGCEVEVLGRTVRHGRAVYLGAFPVSEEILSRVKDKLTTISAMRDRSAAA